MIFVTSRRIVYLLNSFALARATIQEEKRENTVQAIIVKNIAFCSFVVWKSWMRSNFFRII